jgi:hypothetical protein
VNAGHTLRGDVAHGHVERAIGHWFARRRHLFGDERHGVVLQQPCRLASPIADDLAAGDVGDTACHARCAQR